MTSFSIPLSGMRAAMKILDVSAHNTANMNTDGFKKQTIRLEERADGGVVVNIGKSNGPGALYTSPDGKIIESSNTDYAEEAVSRITAKHLLSANIAAFKTAVEMEKSIIDIKA